MSAWWRRHGAKRNIKAFALVDLKQLDDAEASYRKCLAIIPDEPKSVGEIEYINQQRKKTT